MRTREEIVESSRDFNPIYYPKSANIRNQEIILEVLLDIRDLLIDNKKN